MDRSIRQLLSLLSAAMGTGENNIDLQDADWNRLFSMSKAHNIIPMIYEALQKSNAVSGITPGLSKLWRDASVAGSIKQMYRTMEFLAVYEKLNRAGMKALVVKGIVCRYLYQNHYFRSSSDEDVYIQINDFDRADAILKGEGFLKEKETDPKNSQETVYRSTNYGLVIELHTNLFDTNSEIFGPLNSLFADAFQNPFSILAEQTVVYTLPHNLNLLYLVLHSIKHFLAIGFGIRQVCDIIMYCNTYGREVDWEYLWKQLRCLGYDVLLMNLLDIGVRYLGLNEAMVRYPKEMSAADIHSEALLEDIIRSGIFGRNLLSQSKTSSMSINSVIADRNHKEKKAHRNWGFVLKAIFPGFEVMGKHYPYCRKYSLLLPIAWLNRIAVYIKEMGNPVKVINSTYSSYAIGRKRVELLKEYKIIGRI